MLTGRYNILTKIKMKKNALYLGLVLLGIAIVGLATWKIPSEDSAGKLKNKLPGGSFTVQSNVPAPTPPHPIENYYNQCMSSSQVTDIINNEVITYPVPKPALRSQFCIDWAEYWYARTSQLSSSCNEGDTTNASGVPIVSEDGGITRNPDGSLRTQTITFKCEDGQWTEEGSQEYSQPAS